MPSDPIKVRFASLDDLKSQVLNLANALNNAEGVSVLPARSGIASGAGQFLAEVGDALERFTQSWRLWLDTASDDASVLGASVGQASIDFSALDTAGSDIHISLT
jgi:hypothetical protein